MTKIQRQIVSVDLDGPNARHSHAVQVGVAVPGSRDVSVASAFVVSMQIELGEADYFVDVDGVRVAVEPDEECGCGAVSLRTVRSGMPTNDLERLPSLTR